MTLGQSQFNSGSVMPMVTDNGSRIEISVVFSGGEPTQADTTWNAPEQPTTAQPEAKGKGLIEKTKNAAILGLIKQGTFSIINRVGGYTGDYILQNRINTIGKISGIIGTIATLNPVAIASVGVSLTIAEIDRQVNFQKADIQARVISQISGNSSVNRSRGSGRYI